MVMVTRSAYRKATESLNSSDISQNNIIGVPPWCSSGKVYERRKPRKALPTWETQTSYPLRENIWEYLNDKRSQFDDNNRKHSKNLKRKIQLKYSTWKLVMVLILLFIGLGLIVPFSIPRQISEIKLLKRFIPDLKVLVTFPSTSVSEECCHRLRHLYLLLSRIELDLRYSLKIRRKFMLTSSNTNPKTISTLPIRSLIHGAKAIKGSSTKEWGAQVALWGVVPLWRIASSPNTILSLKQPKPSDCWPFSGSSGEVIIDLPRRMSVTSLSLEHVRPDTTKSAPKNFIVYGVLENGTYVKAADGAYNYNKPAKQYYSLNNGNAPLKRIVFRVLSNQGNPKYTCIYRVHVYRSVENTLIL